MAQVHRLIGGVAGRIDVHDLQVFAHRAGAQVVLPRYFNGRRVDERRLQPAAVAGVGGEHPKPPARRRLHDHDAANDVGSAAGRRCVPGVAVGSGMGDDLRASQQRLKPRGAACGRRRRRPGSPRTGGGALCRDLIRRHARIRKRLARLARISASCVSSNCSIPDSARLPSVTPNTLDNRCRKANEALSGRFAAATRRPERTCPAPPRRRAGCRGRSMDRDRSAPARPCRSADANSAARTASTRCQPRG